jgi:hypothetical protein
MYANSVLLVQQAKDALDEQIERICHSTTRGEMLDNALVADDLHQILHERLTACEADAKWSAWVN